jgi:predicted small lipoprotein YifL
MKRCFIAVCAIATAVALSGCGQRDGEQFLGKWENAKRKETVEITKNGDSFLVADTHPNFAFGGLQTDKIPATYQSGVLQVATGFGTMNIGYDKAHDLLLMPTMGGTAELTRVK